MIEYQKNYYSDPIFRTLDSVHLDHGFCVPGLIEDGSGQVCFGSRVSPIIRIPGPTFSLLCLESHV